MYTHTYIYIRAYLIYLYSNAHVHSQNTYASHSLAQARASVFDFIT